MSIILFFVFFFGVVGLAHWYVGRRFITAAGLTGGKKLRAWLLVAFVLIIPQASFLFFLNGIQSHWLDIFSLIGFVVLGFFSLLFTFTVLRDFIALAGNAVALIGRKAHHKKSEKIDRERRQFIIHSSNLGIAGLAVATTGYGFYEARRRAIVEQVEIPLTGLPAEFDGFRIVQFTDLHVGPTIKRRFVEGISEQIHELKGDLLAFTGDLVDGSVSWLRDDVAPLAELGAPFGKFFITGNHEYYSGAESWVKEAGRIGFDVLLNEHRIIERQDGRIILAGITDYSGGDYLPSHRSDPKAAFLNAPESLTRILLAHQPRSIYTATQAGVDLQISGHTHGGQFLPWNYFAALNQPYIKGLHRHENAWVYVSRGTGYWGPPLRLGNAPEITVITLRKAQGA